MYFIHTKLIIILYANLNKSGSGNENMWKKDKRSIKEIDSQIIDRDFIIVDGTTLSYSLCFEKYTGLKGEVFLPILHMFRVRKNHPLKIFSAGSNHIY